MELREVVAVLESRREDTLAGGRFADAHEIRPAALEGQRFRADGQVVGVGLGVLGGRRMAGDHREREGRRGEEPHAKRRRGADACHWSDPFAGKPRLVAATAVFP
jgi:hypothetical protein